MIKKNSVRKPFTVRVASYRKMQHGYGKPGSSPTEAGLFNNIQSGKFDCFPLLGNLCYSISQCI